MTSLDDLPIRDDLRGLSPYGAPQVHVPVALNVNENSFGVPEEVARTIVEALAHEIPNLNRYPDREFVALRGALASYLGHGIQPEQVWAGNGSNEVLQHVLQAFGGTGRSLLSFTPSYSMYPLQANGVAMEWIAEPRAEGFGIEPDEAAKIVRDHDPDVIILCTPNNPTGTLLPNAVIEAVYEASTGIVVVDEAYFEFAPEGTPSALTLLPGRPRLLVSRTMSKAFAFAGVRLGYLAADAAVIDALRLVRLPYHLSALTQAAARAALQHSETMLSTVRSLRDQRDRLIVELRALGFEPHESAANFVLFGGVRDPHATFEALLEAGILVRDVGIPNTLRVSSGTESEITRFLDALRALGPGGAPRIEV
ncbi:histidinol-phosphate transaminase [Humidisolicoccus flavus]|uniref:histidinol-phosphate transaminase n=1 Tax=Humidisolicoccus flavus TaxID=3111414 RepID=UPI0032560498